jgi:flagellar secretion chaperone FliS
MLYRGAVVATSSAIVALESRRHQDAHNQLLKAQAIVTELLGALDFDRGGELARQLGSIYPYLHQRLVAANVKKDASVAREVEAHLRALLEAWETIARQAAAQSAARAA